MKSITIVSIFCCCLMTQFGCKDVILIPTKGTITGIVTDNNGTPLAGVQVSATYDAPSQGPGQPPFPTTVTTVTDNYGYYRLADVWDAVTLAINQSGFLSVTTLVDMNDNNRPVLNLTLSGSPTIENVTLNKTTLVSAPPDTITIRLEVKDVFNANTGANYTVNFFLKAQTGATTAILPATLHAQSLDQYLFDAFLTSGEYPAGTYGLQAEVQDPDGNRQQVDLGEEITVE